MEEKTTTTTTTVKEEKTEPVRIKLLTQEHIQFDPNIESCFMNTIEVCTLIDDIFSQSFRDYAGCKIATNNGSVPMIQSEVPYGALYVSLYFKPNAGDGPIANIEKRISGRGNSRFESLKKMSGMNSGRTYEFTTGTYEALEEFRFFKKTRPNWNAMSFETAASFGYATSYNQEIVAYITGLSLEEILNFAYGTEENGKRFQYQAVPVQLVAGKPDEYVLQITKLDISKLNGLRRTLGGPIQNTEFHQYVK